MKNKKILVIALAVIMAFSMTGCEEILDNLWCPLNGNWDIRAEFVHEGHKMTMVNSRHMSNGNWEQGMWAAVEESEFVYMGMFKGTYSISGSEVTKTVTQVWGPAFADNNPFTENKWYTASEALAAGVSQYWIPGAYRTVTYTYTLSSDGNTLTITEKRELPPAATPEVYTRRVGSVPTH